MKKIDFFDKIDSLNVQILDTDYDTFAIAVECFDNEAFAKENLVEPVHMLKVQVFTRSAEADPELLGTVLDVVTTHLPSLDLEDFTKIPYDEQCKDIGFGVNDFEYL